MKSRIHLINSIAETIVLLSRLHDDLARIAHPTVLAAIKKQQRELSAALKRVRDEISAE